MSENVFKMPRQDGDAQIEQAPSATEAVREKPSRGRSTIEFPYADLSDAMALATTIQNKGAAPLSKDQLAAAMGQPPNSGSFVSKVHTARQFGLVELLADGRVKLTDLGFEAIDRDETRQKAAWAAAFLNVPLFKRAYTEFRNRALPPRPHGLEQAFVGFGVLEKRKTNARWSFDRSAKQAGFFEAGDDRLVMPVIADQQRAAFPEHSEPVSAKAAESGFKPAVSGGAADEPLIRGLLDRLPPPGTEWAIKDRVRWLRALAVNFGMVYGGVEDGDLKISPALALVVPPAPASAPAAAVAKTTPPQTQVRKAAEPSATWEPPAGAGDLDDEIPF